MKDVKRISLLPERLLSLGVWMGLWGVFMVFSMDFILCVEAGVIHIPFRSPTRFISRNSRTRTDAGPRMGKCIRYTWEDPIFSCQP